RPADPDGAPVLAYVAPFLREGIELALQHPFPVRNADAGIIGMRESCAAAPDELLGSVADYLAELAVHPEKPSVEGGMHDADGSQLECRLEAELALVQHRFGVPTLLDFRLALQKLPYHFAQRAQGSGEQRIRALLAARRELQHAGGVGA